MSRGIPANTLSHERDYKCWHIYGLMNYADFYRKAVTEARNGAHFVEVGVLFGRSICYLVEEARRQRKRIRVDGIDPFRSTPLWRNIPRWVRQIAHRPSWMDVTQANIEWAGVADRIRLFQMESQEAVKRYRDGSLDFVWIDGDHTYPSVLADCQAWWPKIRPGGLFAGHDYDLPDVWKGVRDAGLSVKVMGNAWYLYKPLV